MTAVTRLTNSQVKRRLPVSKTGCVQIVLPHAAEAHDVLLRLLLDHVDHVVDGDHADQPAGVVDHRRRDQVVLAEDVGHLLLVHRGRHGDQMPIP